MPLHEVSIGTVYTAVLPLKVQNTTLEGYSLISLLQGLYKMISKSYGGYVSCKHSHSLQV